MASPPPPPPSNPSSSKLLEPDAADVADANADLAQALQEITRGEKTAQALESHLTSLEKKIDALLASFGESEQNLVTEAGSKHVGGDDEEEEGRGDSGKA